MKRLIEILTTLILGTRGSDPRSDAAVALPMSRSGIYGSYSLHRKPLARSSEAAHAEPGTAEVH